jgi:hypothetical protein
MKTHRAPSLKKRIGGCKISLSGSRTEPPFSVGTYKLKNGNILVIDYDSNSENPRKWDNVGTIIWFTDYLSRNHINPDNKHEYRNLKEFSEYEGGFRDKIAREVDIREHGNINFKLGGRVTPESEAIIYVSIDKVRKLFGVKNVTQAIKNQVLSNFKSELDLYTQWANGEVYCYVLYDRTGGVINSVCGFYSIKDVLSDAGVNMSDIVGKANKRTIYE